MTRVILRSCKNNPWMYLTFNVHIYSNKFAKIHALCLQFRGSSFYKNSREYLDISLEQLLEFINYLAFRTSALKYMLYSATTRKRIEFALDRRRGNCSSFHKLQLRIYLSISFHR